MLGKVIGDLVTSILDWLADRPAKEKKPQKILQVDDDLFGVRRRIGRFWKPRGDNSNDKPD